ncbi:hypothetical protein MIMGU_mgv11b022888mg [Erythranthe guttata]|uniref:H15 domain-containing protein n=2 Tax=Erythranthe guttata TaxID=4155 RepID=A0A022QWV4_ERYGU|nr:hypothetical protein MIMGU_mgv11b022888mg [Erythranthe guttata]
MIERAIRELNEKEGSTEPSISRFIFEQYNDLPLAHWTLLKHHLNKRCESGDIAMTPGNRYMLARANPSPLKKNNNIRNIAALPIQDQENNVFTYNGDDGGVDDWVIEWANELIQEPGIGIQDHVAVDLDELENLSNKDLFQIITDIDTLNPISSTIEVHKDEKSADQSLQQGHRISSQSSELINPGNYGVNTSTSVDQVKQGAKRGRGRPRKHEKKELPPIKRPRGRPPKRLDQDNKIMDQYS